MDRTVSVNGTISVSNQTVSVGKQRSGHIVDVRIMAKLLEVWEDPTDQERATDQHGGGEEQEDRKALEHPKRGVKPQPDMIRDGSTGPALRLRLVGQRCGVRRNVLMCFAQDRLELLGRSGQGL